MQGAEMNKQETLVSADQKKHMLKSLLSWDSFTQHCKLVSAAVKRMKTEVTPSTGLEDHLLV